MTCDICNTSGSGTIVKAQDFSRAVEAGFNPIAAGLVPDLGLMMGTGSSYPSWRVSAISGSTSKSDWDICAKCMPHLKPYLASADKPGPRAGASSGRDQHAAKESGCAGVLLLMLLGAVWLLRP
jgi:hypothetical protein